MNPNDRVTIPGKPPCQAGSIDAWRTYWRVRCRLPQCCPRSLGRALKRIAVRNPEALLALEHLVGDDLAARHRQGHPNGLAALLFWYLDPGCQTVAWQALEIELAETIRQLGS